MARKKDPTPTRRAVRTGLIFGVIAVYLAATGIVERFDLRNIVFDFLQLGDTLLILVALGAGYVGTRLRGEETRRPSTTLGRGALAGLLTGGMLAAFLVVFKALIDGGLVVRDVLVSISPGLLNDIISFGQDTWVGAGMLLAFGGAVAAVGAGAHLLPRGIRRPLLTGVGVTLLVSMMEPFLRPILAGLSLETDWLYKRGGLTPGGTVIVFAVATGVAAFWGLRGQQIRSRARSLPAGQRRTMRIVLFLLLIGFLIVLPQLVGRFVSDVLGTVGLYVLLGLGLNIVVGYAGLLDLGYVAFFAIGAYAMAIFTSRGSFLVVETGLGVANLRLAEAGWTNFWVALPLVVIVAVLLGVLIGAPVLRLRGDYLAIVTLGFGEIIGTLVASNWLDPYLGGAQGIIQIPAIAPASLALRRPERLYYIILAFCLIAAYISYRLVDSRVGRAWAAMREDESVAEAMGISVIKYKLLAFAMGAGIGCLGGAFFAAKIGSVFPNSYTLLVSINVLAVIILGGMGSIPGVVVGSIVLVGLPELLREFAEYRLLVYGAILVAIMIYRPEGLVPNVRRRRELRVEGAAEEVVDETVPPVVTGGV